MTTVSETTSKTNLAELIAVSKLEKSPLNVRKTASKIADKELKASIMAHGLMQNLVVTDAGDGTFQVIAGGRRLGALQELIQKKKLPTDHAVPCQVVTAERAAEMSLAENTVRAAMHPMDEYEAFAGLVEQGEKPEAIAKRFGVTRKHVEQRLRLGRVAPALRQAYREEKLSMDALTAYALTDDQAKQMRVYESLKKNQYEYSIRRALTESMVEADDKLAKYVGLEAYKAAGGTVKEDLFGDDVFLEDAELVSRLAGEKLEAEAEKLREEGWSWVEIAEERDYRFIGQCDRIRPVPVAVPDELTAELEVAEAEQTRIAALLDETDFSDKPAGTMEGLEAEEKAIESRLSVIEQKLESYIGFDPEQMKSAGVYVSIGYGGKLEVDRGLVKPEDKKAAKVSVTTSGGDETQGEPKAKLSEPLKRDLEAYRLQAAQAEIAMHPAIAFDLLVFNVACGVLDHVSPFDGPDVHFRQSWPRPSIEGETLASKRLEAIREGLSVEWLTDESETARFDSFQRLPDDQKQRLLAYCTAMTLKPKLASEKWESTAYDAALGQTDANVAEYWRPTKENYLGRINREQLLGIYEGLFGSDFTSHRRNYKKSQLVEELDKAFADPENQICTDKLKSWLPEGMGFSKMPEAKPAKAKKSQKAA